MHSLRDTFATLSLEAGRSVKWVSQQLGHRDASLTLNTYAHALPDEETYKASALANARHEQIAQLLARGATRLNAYVEVYKCHLGEDERKEWCRKQLGNQPGGVHNICSRPDVRARVNVILDEHHERRMSIEILPARILEKRSFAVNFFLRARGAVNNMTGLHEFAPIKRLFTQFDD
jgi:hypothetical protein